MSLFRRWEMVVFVISPALVRRLTIGFTISSSSRLLLPVSEYVAVFIGASDFVRLSA